MLDQFFVGFTPAGGRGNPKLVLAGDSIFADVPEPYVTNLSTASLNEIERVARRMEAILSAVPGVASEARFRSGVGRRFTYYDGFVFESFGENLTSRQPLASGGRYDGLIEGLSRSRASASGIGGVVRPDRILRAKGEAA